MIRSSLGMMARGPTMSSQRISMVAPVPSQQQALGYQPQVSRMLQQQGSRMF